MAIRYLEGGLRRPRRPRHAQRARSAAAGAVVAGALLVAVAVVVPDSGPEVPAVAIKQTFGPSLGQATKVPDKVLETVGVPRSISLPVVLKGQPALLSRGKPEVVYIGAGYCPYCAVARWSLQVALSKFGKFSQLGPAVSSSATDVDPGVKSWGFRGSHYSSSNFTFTAADFGRTFPSNKALSPLARQLLKTYDTAPYTTSGGSIPFIDIDNRYLQVGASASTSVLEHLTLNQISLDLHHPDSPVARSLDGASNYLIATFCLVAGQQSAAICSSVMITRAEATLGGPPPTTTTTATATTTTTAPPLPTTTGLATTTTTGSTTTTTTTTAPA
jgi:Domain of unknown function (DUF929)